MTITATPHPDMPQVSLRITRTDTSTLLTIWRTDSAGTHQVRLLTTTNTRQSSFTLVDYEPAFGVVAYFTSDGDTAEADLGRRLPTFSLPYVPSMWRSVIAVNIFDGPRTAATVVHDIIDSPHPIATLRTLAARRGRMDVLVRTWAEVKELEALLGAGHVVLYRESENPGMDLYLIPTRIHPQRQAGIWIVSIEWAEAGRTSNPIDVRERTFATLRDESSSFAELAAETSTFSAALTGSERL